jgi:hypothetical protein
MITKPQPCMAKLSYNSQTWGYQNPRMEVEDSSRGIEEKDKASLHEPEIFTLTSEN